MEGTESVKVLKQEQVDKFEEIQPRPHLMVHRENERLEDERTTGIRFCFSVMTVDSKACLVMVYKHLNSGVFRYRQKIMQEASAGWSSTLTPATGCCVI